MLVLCYCLLVAIIVATLLIVLMELVLIYSSNANVFINVRCVYTVSLFLRIGLKALKSESFKLDSFASKKYKSRNAKELYFL